MELSDELQRDAQSLEATCAKLRRQCVEGAAATTSGGDFAGVGTNMGGLEAEDSEAIESFEWNEAKYPSNRPLKELVERVMEGVHRTDDALKVKLSEYSSSRANLAALSRKSQGSLAVREIGSLVKEEDYVSTENLCTCMLVVPNSSKKEFTKTYERYANFSFINQEGRSAHVSAAVPRSAKVVAEDKDYTLYRVVCFSRTVDTFKQAAREKGVQVREFKFDEGKVEEERENLADLKQECREMEDALHEWSRTAYR